MFFRFASIGLAALFSSGTIATTVKSSSDSSQNPPHEVTALMALTSDKGVLEKIRTDYTFRMGFDDLRGKFSDKRFRVIAWAKEGAILVDLESGPIGARAGETIALQALLYASDENGVTRLAKLNARDRASVLATLRIPPLFPDGFDLGSASVGLSTSCTVTIKGGDGRTVSQGLAGQGRSPGEKQAVSEHPLRNREPVSDDERQSIVANADKKLTERDELQVHLYGAASAYLGTGLGKAGLLVEGIYDEIRKANAAIADSLAKRLHPNGKELPTGDCQLKDLPPGLQRQLADAFALNWRSNGFTSQIEAQSYMANCSSLSVRSSIDLSFCRSPGAGPGHPGQGGIVSIAYAPGGFAD